MSTKMDEDDWAHMLAMFRACLPRRGRRAEYDRRLAEHRARGAEEAFHHSRAWHAAFTAIRHGHVPVVAALHGATVGGGLELAATCHFRLADTTAFFALPEGIRGIMSAAARRFMSRLLRAARMADMMPTGRVLDANMAERVGLVQYLAPKGDALAKAGELAAKMAGMARLAVLGVLHALPRIQDISEADGLFVESLMAALSQSGAEAAARLADFVGKRGAKVRPPSESSLAVSQGAASGVAAAADID
jgi:(methylthio)acryloyl-CoA hydratase